MNATAKMTLKPSFSGGVQIELDGQPVALLIKPMSAQQGNMRAFAEDLQRLWESRRESTLSATECERS